MLAKTVTTINISQIKMINLILETIQEREVFTNKPTRMHNTFKLTHGYIQACPSCITGSKKKLKVSNALTFN